VLAVAFAQNILMRKLGIATREHVESANIEWYLNMFRDWLSDEQVQMIKELFIAHPPVGEAEVEAKDSA
jgi:hypothetical protein